MNRIHRTAIEIPIATPSPFVILDILSIPSTRALIFYMGYRSLVLSLLCTATTAAVAAEPPPFELKDGDRVVFLGNTLIEREQKYGYWELMLTMAWPERNVTFRNLGWSGDTVWGESRAGFGTQADGFKKLVEEVNAAKPTVIFVGYGNVEAFDGEKGLPRFIEGYNKLLDELKKTKARVVVLGPVDMTARVPNGVAKMPEPAISRYNAETARYASSIQQMAEKRGHRYLPAPPSDILLPLAEDGLQRTSVGYVVMAQQLAHLLDIHVPKFQKWVFDKPLSSELDQLRTTIIKKNELFFHRWRPQNETYLFGFRKHEQGNNAKEVFEFDPLVVAEEKKIAELRVKLAAEWKEARDGK